MKNLFGFNFAMLPEDLNNITMIERKEVLNRKREWGNKPCTHTDLAREVIDGNDTGNKVCVTCGREIYTTPVEY